MKNLILLAAGVFIIERVANYLKIDSLSDLKSSLGDLKDIVATQLKNVKSFAMN